MTPTYAVNMAQPFKVYMSKWLGANMPFMVSLLSTYFAPLIVILVNFIIIPTLVNLSVSVEDHPLNSSIQSAILWRIFFFMLLNVLLIPITEATTALALFQRFEDSRVSDWPTMLSSNMMAQQYVFIKLIIQLTFITNGLTLLDVPHRLMAFFYKSLHDREQKDSLPKQPYIDDYQYDLGYNQSYVLVIFMICLLFCPIVPIISLFGSAYFYLKYISDKYNLVFTYYNKHEFGGHIRTSVKNFMLGIIFVYMFVMISFYGYKFPKMPYYWFGVVVTIIWAALYYFIASN